MRNPINGTITVTGKFKEKATGNTGLPDAGGVRRHIGTDLRTEKTPGGVRGPIPVYAIADGKVTRSYESGAGQTIEYRINVRGQSYLVRNMHLSRRDVKAGDTFKQGHQLGMSGNSGGVAYHLHIDVRLDGNDWDDGLSYYVDPLALIADNPDAAAGSPGKNWIPADAVGKDVILSRSVSSWRIYKPGTYTEVAKLNPKKNGGRYLVEKVDSLPNRVIITSPTYGRVSLPVDADATFARAA